MQDNSSQSYREIHQYTYFDSTTKKYLDQKRKNQVKKEQNRIEKERRQLAQCTFKPAIESKNYHDINKKLQKIKDGIRKQKNTEQNDKVTSKDPTYQRLINWGTRKQFMQRQKVIQRQLELLNMTKSHSKEKQLYNKLNKSLEDPTRSGSQFEGSSIKTIAILTRQQLNSTKNNYRTIHSHNRSKFNE